MNLIFFDWSIVVIFLVAIIAVATYTRAYVKSVADFLAAGRCAGRYLLTVSAGMASLGAISIVANFQMYYQSGFSSAFWSIMFLPTSVLIAISGFVIYRYRQTRALTLAQFFEMRYSRRFRIFAGFVIFTSGILNFGIFPAVGARFFITFCGFPDSFTVAGLSLSTFPTVMIVLLVIALYFTYMGGQIAITLTDFIQGFFCTVMIVVISLFFLYFVRWPRIEEVLLRPENIHMIHPFRGGNIPDFNVWYFIMGLILALYGCGSWQGAQGYACSAISPHEAKMGGMIATLRGLGGAAISFLIPIGAYVMLYHPDFLAVAGQSNAILDALADPQIQDQMRVPVVMSIVLPVGLMGLFTAVMFAAFISTHDTYLHSWGVIFIQDVIMPFRKKPFTPKQHMHLLRLSILGVAIFIFFFSLVWPQKEPILLWFQITGAIYLGGAGAVMIGGLYWKKGTTAAAYCSLITGSTLSVTGIVLQQTNNDFGLNGMQMSFIAAAMSVVIYLAVSLLGRRKDFNLDKLLHRGKYAVAEDVVVGEIQTSAKSKWQVFWSKLGLTDEFSTGDRIIFFSLYGGMFFWVAIFIFIIIFHFIVGTSPLFWIRYWRYYALLSIPLYMGFTLWILVGGIVDARKMFRLLRTSKKDEKDDGWVEKDDKS
jgi:solute:Na+ symporter, SSS family